MSIARKLFLGFSGAILLTAIIAGLGLYHVAELKQDAQRAEQGRRNGLKLREIQLKIVAQKAAARDCLRERKSDAMTAFLTEGSLARLNLNRLRLKAVDELDADQIRRLFERHEQFSATWRHILEQAETTPIPEGQVDAKVAALDEEAQGLNTMTEAIIDSYEDRVRAELRMVEKDAKTAYTYLWVDTVLALLVCTTIAYIISRQITIPVRNLVDVTVKVGAGDLEQRAKVTSGDELGQFAAAFNAMVEQLQRSRAEVQDYSRSLEQKVAERTAELQQADKMASLGQLAGGVAHELNNPLGSILMNVNLVMETLDPASEGYSDLKRIEDDALRCKRIIENLLDFSRQSAMTRKPVDVNEIVQRTVALLQHEAELRKVSIDCTYGGSVSPIAADPSQIQQVLVNIVINAMHAMAHGGRVRVATGCDDRSVVIRIADEGPGIPAGIRGKIFDPFFTTKDTGTGLGLSICYGIIEKHKGSIRVSSLTQAEVEAAGAKQSPGTTFEIRLPTSHDAN